MGKSRAFARLALWVGLAGAAANCSDSTGPSVVSPTAMQVDPMRLDLVVGDTAEVRVVLLASGQPIPPNTRTNGGLRVCNMSWMGCVAHEDSVATVVGYAGTATAQTLLIAALRPGETSIPIHYLVETRCEDPPECLTMQEIDYLPSQNVGVRVR